MSVQPVCGIKETHGNHTVPQEPPNGRPYNALCLGWPPPDPNQPGCWVAFNWDGSAFVPFADGDEGELAAWRYAGPLSMNVRRVIFGDEDWMKR